MPESEDRCKSLRNACDRVFRTGLFILLQKNGCPHAPADEGIQLSWLTTVLMDNNNLTSDSFQKCLLFTILCETWTIKHQQMVKMNHRVPEERLSTSSLNHVSKSTPAQNFRKKLGLIWHSWIVILKWLRQIFRKLRKCEIKSSLEFALQIFLKFWL